MSRTTSFNATACTLIAAFVLASGSGCATMVSKKQYPVAIENASGPTYFSVRDQKNKVLHQGVTPSHVTLTAKEKPFKPAKYSVIFAGQGNASQRRDFKAKIDPWFAGNFLFGGVIGMVVDGVTGAMYRLPATVRGSVPRHLTVADVNASGIATQNLVDTSENSPEDFRQVSAVNESLFSGQ